MKSSIFLLFLFALSSQCELIKYRFKIRSVIGNPDGYPRPVITIYSFNDTWEGAWNRQRAFPAPLIRARQGDQLEIQYTNMLRDQSTSIHFHGLHMFKNPWMDGVAMITQCPIHIGHTFTYKFNLTQTGTYWYHSHSHQQYADGLIGPIIIDPPKGEDDPILIQYPYDPASDHLIMIQEWYHESWQDIMAGYQGPYNSSHLYRPRYPWPPTALLINGHGRFDCHTTDCTSPRPVNECHEELQCYPLRESYYGPCEIAAHDFDEFTCHNGQFARLRLINAASSAPLRFWIDQHSLLIVARDGIPVEPYEVPYIAIPVGQRLDVIVRCNQDPDYNYLIFVAFPANFVAGANPTDWVSALFAYPNATKMMYPQRTPSSNFTDDFLFEYKHLKPLNATRKKSPPAVKRLRYDFSVIWNNSINDALEEWQMNNKTFIAPKNQPLLQTIYFGDDLKSNLPVPTIGHLGSSYETYIEFLEVGQVYEILMVNNDIQQHPYHLHGYTVELISAGTLANLTSDHYDLCTEWKFDMVPVDFDRVLPPYDQEADILSIGDTFTVPRKGFVVFRFKADNPGPWLFHCHMEWHIDPGLVVIFSVGQDQGHSYKNLIPPPSVKEFPTCSQTKQQWPNYKSSFGVSMTLNRFIIFSLLFYVFTY